jgi:hypothetical protein
LEAPMGAIGRHGVLRHARCERPPATGQKVATAEAGQAGKEAKKKRDEARFPHDLILTRIERPVDSVKKGAFFCHFRRASSRTIPPP